MATACNDKPWFFTTEPLLEDRFLNFSFGFLIISITYTTAYIKVSTESYGNHTSNKEHIYYKISSTCGIISCIAVKCKMI